MKKQQIITFLIVLAFVFNSACQPTPTPASVSASPGPLAMPTDTATEYINSGDTLKAATPLRDGITLEVDAAVKLPEKPLVTGEVKRYPFDMERVKAVAQVLFGDAPIYQYVETKPYLMLMGTAYRAQIEIARDILSDSSIEFLTQIADQINGAIASAPEVAPPAELDKISTYADPIILVDTGREVCASFYADMGTYRQLLYFRNSGYKNCLIEEIPPLTLTQDEAVAQAFEVLEQMELSDLFTVVSTYQRPCYHTLVEDDLAEHGYAFASLHEMQGVILMRKINGEAPIFSRQVDNGATAGEFGSQIFWEKIRMQFDNDGLTWFEWNEPGKVEVTESDVAVIDLDAAYAKLYDHLMKSQTRYTYEDYGLDSQDITIKIDRIELGMTYTAGANGAILVLPIWDFYGQIVCETENDPLYVDTLYRTTSAQPLENNSICTLNAITGEFMDRGLR